MKKQLLLCFSAMLLGGTMIAGAQVRQASEPVKLLQAEVCLMAPVWSPDCQYIAVTTDNYTGVLTANADGSNVRVLTSDAGAGYGMAWTADSKAILGNAKTANGTKTLRSYGLDGKISAMGEATRTATAPMMRARSLRGNILSQMLENPTRVAAETPALAEFAGRTILNPALSPDGSRIAFQVVGKGMWIINADGTGLEALGAGSHPQWMPDGKTIVYTVVEDNGSYFTASALMSMNVDNGRTSTILSRGGDLIPMTPAIAPDGSKVAFENAADASIYVVKIKK